MSFYLSFSVTEAWRRRCLRELFETVYVFTDLSLSLSLPHECQRGREGGRERERERETKAKYVGPTCTRRHTETTHTETDFMWTSDAAS